MPGTLITPHKPSVPAKADTRTNNPAPTNPGGPAAGAKAGVAPSAGSGAAGTPGTSGASGGPSPSQQAAAESQTSRYTIAKADRHVLTNPGSGARLAKPVILECYELGSRGPEVQQVQLQLVRLGYLTEKDVSNDRGVYTEKTCEAVRSFQQKYNLEANGAADGETRHVMIQVEVEEFDRKAAARAAARSAPRGRALR